MHPIFFDSWGGAWVACDATHANAKAFGPTGVARELEAWEVEILRLDSKDRTPLSVARAQDRIESHNGWDLLFSGSWN